MTVADVAEPRATTASPLTIPKSSEASSISLELVLHAVYVKHAGGTKHSYRIIRRYQSLPRQDENKQKKSDLHGIYVPFDAVRTAGTAGGAPQLTLKVRSTKLDHHKSAL